MENRMEEEEKIIIVKYEGCLATDEEILKLMVRVGARIL
jgi:hypothetical protein